MEQEVEEAKAKMRKLVSEIRILQREISYWSEKCDDNRAIIYTLESKDSKLKRQLEEQSEMIRVLHAERRSNQTLEEEIEMLERQIELFKCLASENSRMNDLIQGQNKLLEDKMETEQLIAHQITLRFKEEMQKMFVNHSRNCDLVKKLQPEISERDPILEKIQGKLGEIKQLLGEKVEDEDAKDEGVEFDANKSQEIKEPSENKTEEAVATNGEDGGEKAEEPKPTLLGLQMDIAKYKGLYEATKDENHALGEIICFLRRTADDMNTQGLLSKKLLLRTELESKELEEEVKRLKKVAEKKKVRGKLWEKGSKPASLLIPSWSKIDELIIKLDVLNEENDFMRSFLSKKICAKEEVFHLYECAAENIEKRLQTCIEAVRSEFLINEKEPEEFAENEENEEPSEN